MSVPPPQAAVVVPPEALGPGAQVVFGIPVDNGRMAVLVKRVLALSVLMAALGAISAILSLAQGELAGLLQLATLAIPFCGYLGAKNRQSDLLRWFWVCNLCCVVLGVLSVLAIVFVTLPSLACFCDETCRTETYGNQFDPPASVQIGSASVSSDDGSADDGSAEDYLEQVCDNLPAFRSAMHVAIAIQTFVAAFQFLSCLWGKQLEEVVLVQTRGLAGPAGVPMGAMPYAQQVNGVAVGIPMA